MKEGNIEKQVIRELIHHKEIHTFECPKCHYRSWYPERMGDYEFMKKRLLSEIMEKVKRMENTFAYKPIPINKNNIDVKNINKILKELGL